jgi:hypothetical protein
MENLKNYYYVIFIPKDIYHFKYTIDSSKEWHVVDKQDVFKLLELKNSSGIEYYLNRNLPFIFNAETNEPIELKPDTNSLKDTVFNKKNQENIQETMDKLFTQSKKYDIIDNNGLVDFRNKIIKTHREKYSGLQKQSGMANFLGKR